MCHYQGVKMKQIPWLVILSVCLVGCSGSKSAQKVSQETPQIELSDADEFIENPNEEPVAMATEEAIVPSDEPAFADNENSPEIMDAPAESPVMVETFAATSDKTYQVQKNETLMMIAFKLYGDYGKWKELASYNRAALKGSTVVTTGVNLKYMAPAEEFVWNPEGLPYLIKTGDNLGKISTNVYQTPKKWKMIWDNNRPLIKDPNKIFAGFTLYYLESGRDVASEI
jgi:nucleoid-associated protein YgaU